MEKKVRSMEEIQREYTDLCVKAGNLQYQIKVLSKDLDIINETMKDLNLEAGAVKAAEAKVVEEIK